MIILISMIYVVCYESELCSKKRIITQKREIGVCLENATVIEIQT